MLVLLIEIIVPDLPFITGLSSLARIGVARCLQIAGLLAWVCHSEESVQSIGWSTTQWRRGVIVGGIWSLGMALAAGAGGMVLRLTGHDPLAMIRTPLPDGRTDLALFLVVAGLIGPIAEEIFFRGILYAYLRRWGPVAAVAISTALFVLPHATHGLPLVQMAGGLVFAAAYETSRHLIVPMIVHAAGNCAIFLLSYVLR